MIKHKVNRNSRKIKQKNIQKKLFVASLMVSFRSCGFGSSSLEPRLCRIQLRRSWLSFLILLFSLCLLSSFYFPVFFLLLFFLYFFVFLSFLYITLILRFSLLSCFPFMYQFIILIHCISPLLYFSNFFFFCVSVYYCDSFQLSFSVTFFLFLIIFFVSVYYSDSYFFFCFFLSFFLVCLSFLFCTCLLFSFNLHSCLHYISYLSSLSHVSFSCCTLWPQQLYIKFLLNKN